jgi:hypothetical protein
MKTFKDMIFGANIMALIFVLIQIVKNTYNDMTIFALCLLIIYFIIEIIYRFNHYDRKY